MFVMDIQGGEDIFGDDCSDTRSVNTSMNELMQHAHQLGHSAVASESPAGEDAIGLKLSI